LRTHAGSPATDAFGSRWSIRFPSSGRLVRNFGTSMATNTSTAWQMATLTLVLRQR
jgi:hypothetical protein